MGSAGDEFGVERVGVGDVGFEGSGSAGATRSEQQGDLVTVHHSEVVLLVVDVEAEGLLVVNGSGGDIGDREIGEGLLELRRRSGRDGLGVGLAEPEGTAVGVAELEELVFDPVDLLDRRGLGAVGLEILVRGGEVLHREKEES